MMIEILKFLFLTLCWLICEASGSSDYGDDFDKSVYENDRAHYQTVDTPTSFDDAVKSCGDLDTRVPGSGFVPRLFREDSLEKGEDANSVLKGLFVY